jgi:hypothetical protein
MPHDVRRRCEWKCQKEQKQLADERQHYEYDRETSEHRREAEDETVSVHTVVSGAHHCKRLAAGSERYTTIRQRIGRRMPLQIGAALKSGGYRLASRTGALLTVAYLVLYAIYQVAYNGLLNVLYARWGVGATLPEPVPVPVPVAAAVVATSLVALSYLSVVAIRTFVADERDAIPRSFYTDGVVWAVPNLFVGGLVTMFLMAAGFALLIVPGVFLLVSFVFVPVYVAVEGDNFVTAMRRSWALVRGDRLPVLGLVLVVVAAGLALGVVFAITNVVATLAGARIVTPLLAAVVVAPVTMYNLAAVAAGFEQLVESPNAEAA